jgi:UDP-glucose 4-epimerase
MGKILVTGGAGYIGSHVVKLLSKNDFDIIILDNLSTGRKESILAGKFIEGDVSDEVLLKKIFSENIIDGVFHFAGSIIVPESVEKPLVYYQNNSVNSQHLINICLEQKINRFIFSSTAAVYGMGGKGRISESHELNPINPYGRSKLITEWVLSDTSVAYPDFKYVALRYFNVAGADPDLEIGQCSPLSTHLIKVACQVALGIKKELKIYGDDYGTSDGTCIRDYIHITDLAQAHLDAYLYLSKGGTPRVLNCGYGKGHSVREVVAMVKKVSGVDFSVEVVGRRDGDAEELIAESKLIGKELNWVPKYQDLELIVKTAYEWEKKLLSDD